MAGGCAGTFFFGGRTRDWLRILTTAFAEGAEDFWVFIGLAETHVPRLAGAAKAVSVEFGLFFDFPLTDIA